MNDGITVLEQTTDTYQPSGSVFYTRITKRLLDIFLVLIAAPTALPLILISAAFVAVQGGRPFFVQERVGRRGVPFKMVKIRTMVHDADAALQRIVEADADAAREWQNTQKLRNDPRIIRFGRFLRKTSLDELPQLWNVLMGHMSLVGPRPMMPSQKALYPGDAYYSLRPGITGPWQISERSESDFAARARHDDCYLEAVSFREDLKILASTVRVVLRGTGV